MNRGTRKAIPSSPVPVRTPMGSSGYTTVSSRCSTEKSIRIPGATGSTPILRGSADRGTGRLSKNAAASSGACRGGAAQSAKKNVSQSRMQMRDSHSSRATSGGNGVSSSVLFTRIGFLVVVFCLVIFGLVMLYSASSIYSYNHTGDYTAVFIKQTYFVAIGSLVALIVAMIPYRAYSFWICALALAITVPLLLWVLMVGDDALGAKRWIDLGFTTLQPSEFTKIALMLVLAHLVDRCRNHGYSGALVLLMIVSCAIPVGLIIVEPDLGTTIISVIGILAVLWFGGVPKSIIGIILFGLVVLAVIAIVGKGFRLSRISSWIDPWSDPLASGYQLLNSYYAFGGGGVFGVGLGLSKQKFNWLPQSENDFLFAIVGEELGLIGALMVVLLFMGLVFFALRIARNAPDPLGSMIAGASGVIIGAQAFLNMLCVVGALPTTGKPLPFFSAGGSSVLSTMILVGLIVSVSRQSKEANVYDFRREQFTVVEGGGRRGRAESGSGSVLSRLPNPAALVGSLIPQPSAVEHRAKVHNKVVPISRGHAERKARSSRIASQDSPQSQRRITHPREQEALAVNETRRFSRRRPLPSRHNTPRSSAGASRKSEAPISMASLRRSRFPKSRSNSA